jgi:hypothetical protein
VNILSSQLPAWDRVVELSGLIRQHATARVTLLGNNISIGGRQVVSTYLFKINEFSGIFTVAGSAV